MSAFLRNVIRRVPTLLAVKAAPITRSNYTRNIQTGPKILKPAPDFKGWSFMNNEFKEIQLSDYKGKYVVLVFYPIDFSYVAPSEIMALDERIDDFEKLNAQVIGVSVDSHFAHMRWQNTDKIEGGVGKLKFPLLSDIKKQICLQYDVLYELKGMSFNGLFIIDPNGILRIMSVNDYNFGRSINDILRSVEAIKYVDESGEVIPANWKKGDPSMKPNLKDPNKYFQPNN